MMQREGDKVFIRYRDLQGQPQEILVDYVLAATGRRPMSIGWASKTPACSSTLAACRWPTA